MGLRLGIHTSTAGSLEKAALKAAGLGANTFQIFSSSPRMWRPSSPDLHEIKLLQAARAQHDLRPLVIHANYLLNLASIDPAIRKRSIESFRGELERASAIGADYLVFHPGSYRERSCEQGIDAIVDGLAESTRGFGSGRVTVLLENTAGAGCTIGSTFEELHSIREQASQRTGLTFGYCLDTCHLLASGFNIATLAGLRDTVARAGEILGWDHIHIIHANDSKTPLGSRVDRHAGIGQGHIGRAAFRRILQHPKLRKKPFILETPVEEEGDDRRNLDMLKKLAAR